MRVPRFHRSVRIEILLGVLVATLACVAMAAAATTPTIDPDLWWVAAAGREMLSHGTVPRVNLFSYVEPSHPWIMHEWLLGPIYAAGVTLVGPSFFTLLAVVSLTAGTFLVLSMTVGRARSRWVGLATAFVCLACFSGRLLTARPTDIAVLPPLVLARIAFAPRFSRASLVATVAVMLVWTNVHGSFPLGIVLLLVATSLEADRVRRAAAAVFSTIATLVNPYGLSLHRFVVGYLLGREGIYREINAHITEFQSVIGAYGRGVGPLELIGWLLVVVVAVLALRSPPYRIRASFCVVLLAGALRQARHLELAGLLGSILLLPYVDELVARRESAELGERWRKRFVAGVVALVAVSGLGLYAMELQLRGDRDWIDSGPDLLAALDDVPDDARLYIPFSRAGLAIWYGRPRGIRVFFDSRNDCYSAETFTKFRSLGGSELSDEQIASVMASTRTNAVLASARHRLVKWAAQRPEFRAMHTSGAFRSYYSAGGTAAVPSMPPVPAVPPDSVTPPAPVPADPPEPRAPVPGLKPMLAPPFSPPMKSFTMTQVFVTGSQ